MPTPKFDDTLPLDDDKQQDVPKWDDTAPVRFEDTTPIEESPPTPEFSKGDSALRGFANQASLGFADELAGFLEAAGSKVGLRGLGGKSITDIRLATDAEGKQSWDEVYAQGRDAKRAEYDAARKANPKSFIAGELGGGVAAGLAPGLNAGRGASLAQFAGRGAAEGALAGIGHSEAEDVKDIAKDAGKGLIFGAGAGAVAKGADKGLDWLAGKLAKGSAKTLITASEPVDKYVASPEKYRKAQHSVDSVAKDLRPELRQIEDRLEQARALASAKKDVAKRAQDVTVQNLRETQPSERAQRALAEALDTQRGKASDLARQRRDMLRGVDAEFDTSDLYEKTLKELADREVAPGVVVKSDPEIQGIEKFLDIFSDIREQGSKVGAENLLNTRQSIDRMIAPTWDPVGGKHIPPAQAVGRQLRRMINDKLDDVGGSLEGYADLRKALAKETRLAESASDALGNPDAARVLRGMADPKKGPDFQTLKQLDANTGKKIMPELAEYLAAKGKLRDPARLQKTLDSLPQTQAAEEAAKKARLIEKLNERLNGITSDNIDTKLREAMFSSKWRPNLRTNEGLQELARRTGKPVEELVDILGVQAAFGKQGPQGSRLVNLLSSFGPSWAKGPLAASGAMLDVGRGAAAQKILDAYLASRPVLDKASAAASRGIRGAIPLVSDGMATDAEEEKRRKELIDQVLKGK